MSVDRWSSKRATSQRISAQTGQIVGLTTSQCQARAKPPLATCAQRRPPGRMCASAGERMTNPHGVEQFLRQYQGRPACYRELAPAPDLRDIVACNWLSVVRRGKFGARTPI